MTRYMSFICCALFAALAFAQLTHAQTTSTWNGSSGNWTDTVRWNTPNFPNNGNGGLNYIAVINAGTVTLNQDITLNGFTMTGGSVIAPGAGGPFTLTVNNTLNWTGGNTVVFGAGQTLRSNGTATIDNPTLGGTFINAGTVSATAITGTASAIINNLSGATFDGSMQVAGTFNNAGIYAADSQRTIDWNFNNQSGGVVNAANATLLLKGSGTHDGNFNLTSAALQFYPGTTHVFNAGSQISGTNSNFWNFGGNVTVNGSYLVTGRTWAGSGTITFNSAFAPSSELRIDTTGTALLNLATTIQNLDLNGILGGAGTFTFTGGNWNNGTLGGTSLTPHSITGTLGIGTASTKTLAHDLNNASTGIINLTGGTLSINSGVTLSNEIGANLNITGNVTVSGSGALSNAGTITRSTATGTSTISAPFTNQSGGLVNVQTGTLNFGNVGALAGTFDISSAATLAFSGTQTLPGGAIFTGAGTIAAAGGTTTLTGTLTYPNVALTGGTLLGSGSLAVGTLSLGGITLGRDLTTNGSVSNQFSGGTLTVNSGFTLTVPNAVNLQAVAGTITGAGTLANQGTITKTGSGTLAISSLFDNTTGLVQVQVGTVQLSSPTTLAGTVNVSTGATLALGTNQAVGATAQISGAGAVSITGAGVTIFGSGLNSYGGGTTVAATGNALVTGTNSAFGTTGVSIASGGVLRLSAIGNLAATTHVTVPSGGILGLETSFDPTAIVNSTSAGVIAINATGFAQALNQSTLGNGSMFLGSTTTGSYTAATLTPGTSNTYRLGGGGGTLTMSGANVLTGTAATSIGATGLTGTVLISNTNNYSGPTTLAAVTLAVGNNTALGSGTLTINSGSIRADGGPITLANAVTVGGNFAVIGSENLTFTNDVTLNGNRSIDVSGAGIAAFSGNIAGDVLGRSLTKTGVGTLTLSGTNTYSGGTTINAGTLKTTGFSQALGLGNVTVNSGAALQQGSFSNLGGGTSVRVNSGGVLGLEGNFAPSLNPASTGMIAVNLSTYSVPLNQASMGNGQMFIGSQGTGQYNAATLGAGSGSAYRLGAAGGTLTIPNANVLTGFNSLLVGSTQVNGAGTLVLGAAQDFQGNTTINAGSTLVLNAALTGPGTVFVLPGATISGSGSIGGFVNVSGGNIGPGGSPGVLTFNAGVGFASGSKYIWELSDLTTSGSGTVWDRIDVTAGNLTINPAAILDIRFTETATGPNVGDSFWATSRTWNNIIGLSGTATSSGPLAFQIDNSQWIMMGTFATLASGGSGVQLTWTPVPEPASVLAICAVGAGAFGWVRRYRSRKQLSV